MTVKFTHCESFGVSSGFRRAAEMAVSLSCQFWIMNYMLVNFAPHFQCFNFWSYLIQVWICWTKHETLFYVDNSSLLISHKFFWQYLDCFQWAGLKSSFKMISLTLDYSNKQRFCRPPGSSYPCKSVHHFSWFLRTSEHNSIRSNNHFLVGIASSTSHISVLIKMEPDQWQTRHTSFPVAWVYIFVYMLCVPRIAVRW